MPVTGLPSEFCNFRAVSEFAALQFRKAQAKDEFSCRDFAIQRRCERKDFSRVIDGLPIFIAVFYPIMHGSRAVVRLQIA
jgi:hypothetical protein